MGLVPCPIRGIPGPLPFLFGGRPVQKKRATALRQEWGDKPCPHPAFAKEYDLGERTGNYVCTQCGKTFTFKERAELLASRGGAAKA
jgi:hypothetical protein